MQKGPKTKDAKYPLFVDERLTPRPFIQFGKKIKNIHSRDFFPHLVTHLFSQNFSSPALMVWGRDCIEDSEQKDARLNELINQ